MRVEIFAAGDGINYPRTGNMVTCHYTGFLPDGSLFDSSRDRGRPFRFKLGSEQVVPGLDKVRRTWTKPCCAITSHVCHAAFQGVSQLSIGERAKIFIPPHLAYGDRGFPGLVPPDSGIVFDLELITFT